MLLRILVAFIASIGFGIAAAAIADKTATLSNEKPLPKSETAPETKAQTPAVQRNPKSLAAKLDVDSETLDEMSDDGVDFSEGDENLTDEDFVNLQ